MSFAKVAAIAGKEKNIGLLSSPRAQATTPREGADIASSATQVTSSLDTTTAKTTDPSNESPVPDQTSSNTLSSTSRLVDAVKALQVHDSTPSLVVNGSGVAGDSGPRKFADELPDENFQRVDSGSEPGTKPPSLDGKSITSGTTFALDERESLRPDDSASVKAAEDDDTFSGRGSILDGSRIGSEAAARYRNQFYEPPDRRATITNQDALLASRRTPHSGSPGQQVVDEVNPQGPLAQIGEPVVNSLFYKQTPDEKLIEALDSTKDRLFLLRLEQQVMEFVKDSKEPFIDLPPCNSFCRMLTHKLADYYHLTHQVDAAAGAVRIYRTPFCRIPRSLTSISTPPTSGNTPPLTMPAMKIMRRGEENGATTSKATSENDSDGKEKTSGAKDKAQLTREEREAQYALARERIFGKDSEKTGEATPETEKSDNEMSRSSSVSNKDRSGKRSRGKQRREDSESFDARSQYKAYYPTPQQPAWTSSPHMVHSNMTGPRNGVLLTNNYPNMAYPPMAQQYQSPMMAGAGTMQYNQIAQQYPQQQQPVQHAPVQQYHGSSMQNYSQPMQNLSQTPQVSPPWQQSMYQGSYQGQSPAHMQQHSRGPGSGSGPVLYAYGQLPPTANPADPKSQHPIPGSFNRSTFNPKTQSFVPGNGGRPGPQPMMPQQQMHQQQAMFQQQIYQQPASHHGSSRMGTGYNGYGSNMQQHNGGNVGYGMARQGSNNSLPSYHASPHIPNRPMVQQNMHQNLPANLPPNPGYAHHLSANGHNGSHLPQYGNAASLPPKPPPAL